MLQIQLSTAPERVRAARGAPANVTHEAADAVPFNRDTLRSGHMDAVFDISDSGVEPDM